MSYRKSLSVTVVLEADVPCRFWVFILKQTFVFQPAPPFFSDSNILKRPTLIYVTVFHSNESTTIITAIS